MKKLNAMRGNILCAAACGVLVVLCACGPLPADKRVGEKRLDGPGGLGVQGLMVPVAACAPGGSCCDPDCTYSDTLDGTVVVPSTLTTSAEGLAMGRRGASADGGSTCRARVTAGDAPLATFYAASRDLAMSSSTETCTRVESRCDRRGSDEQRCGDVCVAWKTRWDEVREGAMDFVSSTALAGGTLGANSVEPWWDQPRSTSCAQTCFQSWCSRDCSATAASALSCEVSRYATVGASFGAFTGWASTFMGAWWTQGTAPVEGNPVGLSLQNALTRARSYQAANPTHTVAVTLLVDDYPSGCGDTLPATASLANDAFTAWPRIETNVLALGNLRAYGAIAQYGFGQSTYLDPARNVRAAVAQALAGFRQGSGNWQYLIAQPGGGATIDPATLVFSLRSGSTETVIPKRISRSNCGSNDGYWIDYPEGIEGSIRVNLCPRTEAWSQQNRRAGSATYDCQSGHDAEVSFVRTGDFDLTACNAAGLTARALRFDWSSVLPWNTYVRFRLQFASQKSDLVNGAAFEYFATSWDGSAAGWADLSNLANTNNYGWARLTATLYASSDAAHLYSPSISSWGLRFTCVDAL